MSEMTQHPVVQLKDGAIRGRADSGTAAFLGIPYAAPRSAQTGCGRRSP
jgi:para-nitrobenzyl esterase